MGDHAGAMADFAAALALEPGDPSILLARAHSRDAAGDYAGAIADATAALVKGSDYMLTERAQLYFAHGDYDAAMADLAAAITAAEASLQALRNELPPSRFASSPEIAELLSQRCWMRAVASRDLDAARRDCDEALRIIAGGLDDLAASIYDSRALVGLKQGRNENALEDYEIAARLRRPGVSITPAAPGAGALFAHALYGRGIAAKRLGRSHEAQSNFEGAAHWDADVAATYAAYGVTP
jgi:tetratricopeptide (TPR) repeat protein